MLNVLTAELIKLKRAKALLLAFLASTVPALVRFIQLTFGKGSDAAGWEVFLSSGQEIMVLGVMTAIIMLSCYVFGMEYQYNTVSYIFTSRVSRPVIYLGKIAVIMLLISFLFVVSAVSHLIFGYITVGKLIESELLLKYLEATVVNILAYSALTSIMALVSIAARRFAVSAALVLGYVMLVFPFHLKGNAFISPFMIPAVTASKILGSTDYIFFNYYRDITINYVVLAVFLAVLFVIPLTIGMICYKKRDVF